MADRSWSSPWVLYSIQTAADNLEAILASLRTWAAELPPNRLQVIGMSQPKGLSSPGSRSPRIDWDRSSCPDTHAGGACKDFTALADAWQKGADWVVLLGSDAWLPEQGYGDNYAIAKNIEAVLGQLDPETPQVLGIRGCGKCKAGGLCGGGGQIFSRAALAKMLEAGRERYMKESLAEAQRCGMWGDVSNCRVAAKHGVEVKDLPGLHGWHLNSLQLQEALMSTYPAPLTFHYLTLGKIDADALATWNAQRAAYVADAWTKADGDRCLSGQTTAAPPVFPLPNPGNLEV
eukprot:g10428.t1